MNHREENDWEVDDSLLPSSYSRGGSAKDSKSQMHYEGSLISHPSPKQFPFDEYFKVDLRIPVELSKNRNEFVYTRVNLC